MRERERYLPLLWAGSYGPEVRQRVARGRTGVYVHGRYETSASRQASHKWHDQLQLSRFRTRPCSRCHQGVLLHTASYASTYASYASTYANANAPTDASTYFLSYTSTDAGAHSRADATADGAADGGAHSESDSSTKSTADA